MGMSAEAVRPGVDMIKVSVNGPANGIDIAVTILREAVSATGGDSPLGSGPHMDQQGGGAGSGLCALYSADEMGSYAHAAVREPAVTGTDDSGCKWKFADGDSYVTIEMLLPERFSVPSQAPGFRELKGVGDRGYAAAYDLNLWNAVALREGKFMLRVVVRAPLTIEDAVALLTETLSRVA